MARRLIFPLLWLVLAGTTQAQLADPTRPPGAGGTAAGAAAEQTDAVGLQSIIRRQGGKPAALINGSFVELGGRVGTSKVVKIGDDYVVLRSAAGSETLRLTPAVEKTSARRARLATDVARKERK